MLAADRDGELEFTGPAILNPCRQDRGKWSELNGSEPFSFLFSAFCQQEQRLWPRGRQSK
jgi:hypothetical protein